MIRILTFTVILGEGPGVSARVSPMPKSSSSELVQRACQDPIKDSPTFKNSSITAILLNVGSLVGIDKGMSGNAEKLAQEMGESLTNH